MFNHRRSRIETLEKRLALAVTAAVVDGDLVIEGDADGAVEIVAVGDGNYQVTDNGVLIADETTLTGVTDDIRIDIDESAAADNSVTLTLSDQVVDRIFADLGDGANSLQLVGGTAASLRYAGGDGVDTIDLGTAVTTGASLKLGDGDNSVVVNAEVGRLDIKGGDGVDAVTIAAAVAGNVNARLGDGDNSFELTSAVAGNLKLSTGDGVDTVSLAEGSAVAENVHLYLGDGDNTATLAGSIEGSLKYRGLDGDDILTTTDVSTIAGNLSARLGAGSNSVTHNGSITGDFTVVSQNAEDVVTIAETATIGGTQTLGLGEEIEGGGRGHGHCGSAGDVTSQGSETSTVAALGRSNFASLRARCR
jgi:hypothetical protein